MNVRVLSDLHLEHAPYKVTWTNEDLLVIAGDISVDIKQSIDLIINYLDSAPESVRVIVVAGNHDYYGGAVDEGIAEWRSVSHERIHYLENESFVFSGIRFWGATMWTNLDGLDPSLVFRCKRYLTDFEAITAFTPEEFFNRHMTSKSILQSVLADSTEPVVVITHHLPSKLSQGPRWAGSGIGPSFYSTDMNSIVTNSKIKLWIHGHTHSSMDYMHNNTRVVCNPRGYCKMWRDKIKKQENEDFKDRMVIELTM